MSGTIVPSAEHTANTDPQAHAAAQDLLRRLRGALPADIPPDWGVNMFAGAMEDLSPYDIATLTRMAREAWAFLAQRRPGVTRVEVGAPQKLPGGASISVVSILNDDMPFLVDSILGELNARKLDIRLVAHPVFNVVRDANGVCRTIAPAHDARGAAAAPADGGVRESFIMIHIAALDDEAARADLRVALESLCAQIRMAVTDWKPMMARVDALADHLKTTSPPLASDEITEAIAFLQWLAANHFTFLGTRDYAFDAGKGTLVPIPDSALGLLRMPGLSLLGRVENDVAVTPEIVAFLKEPKVLIITKANVRSRVHRRTHLDYIGVKRFDSDGRLLGAFCIVGIFTSNAYTQSPRLIPYLRRKVDGVLRGAGFDPQSHSGKALTSVLENYPRDELFQIDGATLGAFADLVLRLEDRPQIRVLARPDRFGRFASVLVYVMRDGFDSAQGTQIGERLAQLYGGHVSAFHPFFPEGPMVRLHYIIGRDGGETPVPSRATLEDAVRDIVRSWDEGLREALAARYEAARARSLHARYGAAFSAAYRDSYPPDVAAADLAMVDDLDAARPLGVAFSLRAPAGLADDAAVDAVAAESVCVGLKMWSLGRPIPLSERVPILENMGFRVIDERTFEIAPPVDAATARTQTNQHVWLHDTLLEIPGHAGAYFADAIPRLEELFLAAMRGLVENDGYNGLARDAGLAWRDIALLRALSRFLRQQRIPYSHEYMAVALRKHPALAASLVALFHARFDPAAGADEVRGPRESEIAAQIEQALEAVDSLDEDRIVRRLRNAVQAALRTNFYQRDTSGLPRAVIAIKFDSRKLDEMPLPRPLYEIFVHSPRLEGVHLRFGKVARGGIRWSDRREDFRTEVLGLVKTQQVKNAVIIPVGAKGGYVPKRLPTTGGREAIAREGLACYQIFIASLLDITDNFDTDGIVAPKQVVRHDGDDPYLVVAADKGTATFSDAANAIAQAHGFWLDDAFASGGSAGYDHKAIGITARGAWEAVKRHFREMDTDIDTTPFTVAGVGDMSGDVFGNGMLRARTIRLVAAFDHRDIFIDPAPDAEKSYAERARLFALPRSSWQDYDKALISKGGGVFSRAAKDIALTPEMKALLGFDADKATPAAVMNAILKAQVDLLWFGGIGTYVRAGDESDESVGDRANDALRVAGQDLRCRVVGEGANLGVTQRGRIEAARAGRRIETDAIDNSAGVNTSDIEVNIKIALSVPLRDGSLTRAARDALLRAMTDDVAALVLRNNYLQPLALSLAERRGLEDLGFLQRLMQVLEQRGELDRAVEFLPDDGEIAARRKRNEPLTRPELAVLLAYAKLSLYRDILDSRVPDDPYFAHELARYFPAALQQQFPAAITAHRLRREIVATQLANSMINRGGPALAVRIADETGASASDAAAAFAVVRDSYDMSVLNAEIDALDNKVSGALQLELYAVVENVLLDRIVWFLRNVDLKGGLADVVAHYRAGIAAVAVALPQARTPEAQAERAARVAQLTEAGVGAPLAGRLADLPALLLAPDVLLVADRIKAAPGDVAATYYAVGSHFRLAAIRTGARTLVVTDYFDRLALDRARDAIGAALRRLTASAMADGDVGTAAVEAFSAARGERVARVRQALDDIVASGLTVSKLTVAASLLGDLVAE